MSDLAVIGLGGTYMSSLGAFLDAFVLVRHQVAVLFNTRETVTMETQVQLLSPDGRAVRMAGGQKLAAACLDNKTEFRLVHIPGFVVGDAQALDARLTEAAHLCRWLRRQHRAGAIVSASGPAVFLLAEAGLLSAGIAAMSRPLTPLFRRRYPDIRVDHHRPVVEHGKVVTGSGLATDALLVARLVELVTTAELARWLSEATGAHRVAEGQLSEDPLIAHAQLWLEERFSQDVKIADLAMAMVVSQQTLLRHFHRHLNTTPWEYLQRLRVDTAQRFLLNSTRPVEQIAALVGYNDVNSFRRVFRKYTGTSASRYRADNKVRSSAAPDLLPQGIDGAMSSGS